jgi:hypothetical protein
MTAYAINKVCWLVERDAEFRERARRDLPAALADFKLDAEERRALAEGDVAALFRRGGHPFLLQHLARHGIAGLTRELYRERITSLNREDYS